MIQIESSGRRKTLHDAELGKLTEKSEKEERERGYRTYIHICYHPVISVPHDNYSLPHQAGSEGKGHGTLHCSRCMETTRLEVRRNPT